MKLSRYERETIILYNEADSNASIYTHNEILQRQLKKLHEKYPELVYPGEKNGSGGLSYTLPKKWVRIVPPQVRSEAQKRVLAEVNQRRRERKKEEQNVSGEN